MTGHLLCFGYGFSARHLVSPPLRTAAWNAEDAQRTKTLRDVQGMSLWELQQTAQKTAAHTELLAEEVEAMAPS